MAERGEYRSISRSLLAGKDFRKLPGGIRWVFVVLKINANAAGIETWYEAELLSRLTEETGQQTEKIRAALDHLEKSGWIKREDNVLWIVGHLTNDPHFKVANLNHRRGVQRILAGLPHLSIVREFYEAHPDWFPDKEAKKMGLEWVLKPIRRGSRTHRDRSNVVENNSLIPSGTHPDQEKEEEEDKEEEKKKTIDSGESKLKGKYPNFPLSDSNGIHAAWKLHMADPTIDHPRIRNAFAPLYSESPAFTVEEISEGIKVYSEVRATKPPDQWKWWHPNDFVKHIAEWVRLGKMPPMDEYGFTERGKLGMQGAA